MYFCPCIMFYIHTCESYMLKKVAFFLKLDMTPQNILVIISMGLYKVIKSIIFRKAW